MKGIAKSDLLIFGAYTVATMAIVGLFYYTAYLAPKPIISDKKNFEELEKLAQPKELMAGLPIKKILVNLPSKTSRLRFLEIEMSLFPFEEKNKEKIKNNMEVFQDTVINISSKMTPDELNSISGKILLEERIKKEFHHKIGERLISKVFYTKFVVQ